ncbi:MAG: hypothetical protein DMG80_10485 [Acidobacteria bacterium]|nr:MAG: hypothetical protein DMG80_10485 [Acidobacteriota bacterium]
MTESVRHRLRSKILWTGVLVGAIYGLIVRFAFSSPFFERFGGAMTWAFLLGVPFAMGFITIFIIERREPSALLVWVMWPWLPLAAAALGTVFTLFEGAICVVMLFPVGMACASLGGIIAGIMVRLLADARANDVIAGAILLLPMMIAPWEQRVLYSKEIHTTENVIDIAASAPLIWSNIERVRAIQTSELPDSWSHRIGFPDPIEATLSHEGIGGIRHATFTGGVLFIETIDAWEPEQRLGFSIKAQTDQIPNTTLDEHVRVGGAFFDVLHGEYSLEPLGNGMVRLHLSSQQRLSTDFNWYARIWSDATMSDLQSRILKVVKARCEHESSSHPAN